MPNPSPPKLPSAHSQPLQNPHRHTLGEFGLAWLIPVPTALRGRRHWRQPLNRAAQRAPSAGAAVGRQGLSRKGEAFMKNTPLPPTLLRRVAGVPLRGRWHRRGNSKLAGEWLRNTHAFRVALGHVFGRRGAAPANSMMLLPPAALSS